MPFRVGILSSAHLHVWSYFRVLKENPDTEPVGVWDDNPARGLEFEQRTGVAFIADLAELLDKCDAVVIASENSKHADLITAAAKAGKHILCEKPLVTSEDQGIQVLRVAEENAVTLMTAFPCRFSPAFIRLRERVLSGDIGGIKGICATNRGKAPLQWDWFFKKELSGGGALMDHTVHVTDLLRALLQEEVVSVQAQTGSNMYGKTWEDTAILTLEFDSGIFATLDSSWSRPQTYKTWGDVTMNVVGEKGLIELNMFGQNLDIYGQGEHTNLGYGSNLDDAMVKAFVDCVRSGGEPPVTGWDGLQAARVALAGYESASVGEAVLVPSDLPRD